MMSHQIEGQYVNFILKFQGLKTQKNKQIICILNFVLFNAYSDSFDKKVFIS